MVIAVDFDGTIVFDRYPEIGILIPDAKAVINQLRKDGHKVILNTCRDGQFLMDAINFLAHNGIVLDSYNENLPENIEKYGFNCRKISADMYIDDKNYRGLTPWREMYENINKK